jgi:hypothetical protein
MISPTSNIIQMAEYHSPGKTVNLPFTRSLQPKKIHSKPCIFCGLKLKTHNFKGKAVCLTCLKSIPYIFHYN